MKGKALTRLYDCLTAEERFRLVLEALARNDAAEVRRLVTAPPPAASWGCQRLILGSGITALLFTVLWKEDLWRVRYLEQARILFKIAQLDTSKRFLARRRATLFHPKQDAALCREFQARRRQLGAGRREIARARREAVARLKGTCVGLLRFCTAARLKPRRVPALNPTVLREIRDEKHRLRTHIPANKKWAKAVYRGLCQGWPGVEGTVTGR